MSKDKDFGKWLDTRAAKRRKEGAHRRPEDLVRDKDGITIDMIAAILSLLLTIISVVGSLVFLRYSLGRDILQVGGIEILYHCEDDSLNTGQVAQTGINLEDTAGGLQIQEMGNVNPFSKGGKKDSSKMVSIVMYACMAIVAVAVIIFGGRLLLKLIQ